jgi:hypothetical protein
LSIQGRLEICGAAISDSVDTNNNDKEPLFSNILKSDTLNNY